MGALARSDKIFVERTFKKYSYARRQPHLNDDGSLRQLNFFRSYSSRTGRFMHSNMGINEIRNVFQWWNEKLRLTPKKLTGSMARKTFATFGDRLFRFPWRSLMEVTHHKSERQFRKYVMNATWADYESEAHIGRTFTV